uniref:MFS transporter n=1 Tax=Heterorhabditis bacteriophora TaxID=37862 RepID=A0A1I7W9L2_HETBA
MGCALFAVVFMRVQIEKKAVFFGSIGSIPGMIIGFKYFDPQLTAPQKKMLFVSIWTSFAASLFILNFEKKRKTYKTIPDFKFWKALVLIVTGFIGGLNSLIGFYYRAVWEGTVPQLAWEYLQVTIPVSVMMAPIGSFLGSHFHRQVLATFVYVLEAISLLGFVATLPPTNLIITAIIIILLGFGFFTIISRVGPKMCPKLWTRLGISPCTFVDMYAMLPSANLFFPQPFLSAPLLS